MRSCKALYAAINREIVPAKKGARLAFPDLDRYNETDADGVYAYFVITED